MSSYNDWDGVPITASSYFLTDLLRKEYGFNGYVVSDSQAVEFIYSKHHVAADFKDAITQALTAGLNVWTNFREPDDYIINLREAVKEGKLSVKILDERVKEVLSVKFRLGLFDHPYQKKPLLADKIVHQLDEERFAEQLNRESLVLLKNDAQILPLSKTKKQTILITGPLAKEIGYTVNRYGPSNHKSVSIYDGLRALESETLSFDYAKGCDIINPGWPGTEIIETPLSEGEQKNIDQAVEKAKTADVIIAVVGEDENLVGESLSRTSLDLPGRQHQLLKALYATGKPVVLVMINGRPLTINWENHYLPAILEAWFPGPSSGKVIAETLFGDYNPGGKLPVTFPKSIGQIEMNFPFKPSSQASQPTSGDNGFGKTRVNGVLYPFGYGLSYTTFSYADLKIDQSQKDSLSFSFKLKNTGKYKGDEIVQLYFKDKLSSVTVFESQLRAFKRINLLAGEEKTVILKIAVNDLKLLNKDMKWVVEPGLFEVLIGASSEDIKLKIEFSITNQQIK